MCQWCISTVISEHLTSGISGDRRQFLKYSSALLASSAATYAAPSVAQSNQPIEVIFRNGPIYPIAGDNKRVEALAIGGGKIRSLGSVADVMRTASASTTVVDLQGRTLVPGLIDPHNHTVLSSLFDLLLINAGFAQYKTKADVAAMIKSKVASTPAGQWLVFGFYDNLLQGGDWSLTELDAISKTHPIYIIYVNGHVGAANSLAFSKAGVTENIGPLPGGGFFGRGANGKLNGMIYNQPALMKVLDHAIAKPTPEVLEKAVIAYANKAAAAGFTALHEPGTVKPEWIEGLAKLSNVLPIRLSASFSSVDVEHSKAFASLGPSHKARVIPNSRFSLYGMKVWSDGSNQAETAWQTKPYLNTNRRGTGGYKSEQMVEICKNAKAAGWTMLAHCQGDAAVEQYLNALEAVYGANPSTGLIRVEHATMARQDQIDRIKRLGYEPSFMTDFIYLYGNAYRDQIFGNPRANFMVPFGAAAKAKLNYTVHSDNPAAGMPLNPMRHVEIQLMRQCVVDKSIIGVDQRVDIQHAMRAISMHAARQIGLGESLGTLEVGKDADLTLLDGDPFTTSPDKVGAIKASQTWVTGKKMYG